MTLFELITAGLLTAGTAMVCLASVGMLWRRAALDRLHCVALAGTSGLGLIAAAVLVMHPADQFGLKAVLLTLITWCFAPAVSHVQASLIQRMATSDRKTES